MSAFLVVLLWSVSLLAQQDYFTPENKIDGLEYYKKKFLKTCTQVKSKQGPVPSEEMQRLASKVENLIVNGYHKALAENPKVKEAFLRDVRELSANNGCQREANDCRTRLAAIALFYVERFRPDVRDCQGYTGTPASAAERKETCENELRYRKLSLEGVHGSNYGTDGAAMYKKQIIYLKNYVAFEVFKAVFQKDNTSLHICDPVPAGPSYIYGIEFTEAGTIYVGLDPDFDILKKLPSECEADKKNLLHEFLPAHRGEDRTLIQQGEVIPVKEMISGFLAKAEDLIITDVSVTVTSSRLPFYAKVAGEKVLDPKSDEKNLAIATKRALLVERLLEELRLAYPQRASIAFRSSAELAGPQFHPTNLNERYVTRMNPGYAEKIEALFRDNERDYRDRVFVSGAGDLLDEKKYGNLFQARFMPYHGYRVLIRGFRKDEMKCVQFLEKDGKTYFSKR